MSTAAHTIQPVKIMVASTIYHFKTEIEQICATLKGFGYHVINSHIGTVRNLGDDPPKACLNAVVHCDFFLGIILPSYSSGITHQEIQKAIAIDKPRCFLVDRDVTVARKLLEQFMYLDIKKRIKDPAFKFSKTSVLDDIRVIDMYNEAIQDTHPIHNRRWAHEFTRYHLDGAPYIDTQFSDMAFVRNYVDNY
jgi:Domain of unknown function (DUF4062)